jgi:hypothetical protein
MSLNLALLLLFYCLLDVLAFSCSQVVVFYHLLAPLLPESAAQSKLVSLDLMPLLYTSLIYYPPLSYIFFSPCCGDTIYTSHL